MHNKKLKRLLYFAPLVQIALCPVTILFLFTVFTGPEGIPEVNEELAIERLNSYLNQTKTQGNKRDSI